MSRLVFFFCFSLVTFCLAAQEKDAPKPMRIDYQLVLDNDVYTLNLKRDRYYSNGMFPTVRILMDSSETGVKKIRSYQLNHRMYTPAKVRWTEIWQLDRPYAGVFSVSGINEYYLPNNSYYKINLELGILGPASLVGDAQTKWHGWFGMPEPMGWKYQIENTPVVNLHGTRIKPFFSSYNFELSNITNGSIGTVYNLVRQELMVRVGNLRPLFQSAFTGSTLGRLPSKSKKVKEFYMFYAPAVEYVFQNATLQGSLFADNSPHTVDVIHWVWQQRFGMMWSWSRFDLAFTAYWRSPENIEAVKHNYVGIRMNQRF